MKKGMEKRICAHRDVEDAVRICAAHANPMRFFGDYYSPLVDNVSHIIINESAYNSDWGREVIAALGMKVS